MAIKSVSIRIEEEMLKKIGHIADYEGRSVNIVLIRESIKKFEEENGIIDGDIKPDVNVSQHENSFLNPSVFTIVKSDSLYTREPFLCKHISPRAKYAVK